MKFVFSIGILMIAMQSVYSQTVQDMIADAGKDYDKVDAQLNRIYNTILKDYSEDTVFINRFRESERVWLFYRDAEVKALYPYADSEGEHINEYGEMYPMCKYETLADLERDRIKEIMQWYKGESEGDVCSGSIMTPGELKEVRAKHKTKK